MYQMYNSAKPTQIQFTQECTNGKTYLRTRRPKDYGTLENFRNDFDSDYFEKLLLQELQRKKYNYLKSK